MTREHVHESTPEDDLPAADNPADEGTPHEKATRLRGLWSVMSVPPSLGAAVVNELGRGDVLPASSSDLHANAEEMPPVPRMRGLWSVMSPPALVPEEQAAATSPVSPAASEKESPVAEIAPLNPLELAIGRPLPPDRRPGRTSWMALALGFAAVPLSALSLLPGFWPTLPAAGAAFAALWLALQATLEPGLLKQGPIRNASAAILALVALALGPLYFAPRGNAQRGYGAASLSVTHLRRLGQALSEYEQEAGSYPLGGALLKGSDGRPRGGVGWMARLLPYLNEGELARTIDFTRPFDDPVNQPALKVPVEAFFAAGGNRAALADGYAPAHFAGVGGVVTRRDGAKHPLGIFQTDIVVRTADVSDGLSHTWIVGEVARNYAPWGDPENWRSPGKGLNRDPSGFGSATGRGATLLFADGVVKTFSNQTDPELLKRLATRNAADLATDWKP